MTQLVSFTNFKSYYIQVLVTLNLITINWA